MMNIKKLLELYVTFFKIGTVTFGGGLTMLPILERELRDKKKWTTTEELLDYYAIAQSTPGIIAVNVSTFVGHKQLGISGAIASTLGMITPSIIIIASIAKFISNFDSIGWVARAMKGINVGVAALLTYSVIGLAKKTVKNAWNLLLYVLSFSAVYFFHVKTSFVIMASALIGLLVYFTCRRKKGGEK